MIKNFLDLSIQKSANEISFILGHKILAKTNEDWFELKGEALSISEWEDLKDFCLQSNEKVQLETKGFVSGAYNDQSQFWRFSFTEKKECFKAYLTLIQDTNSSKTEIENPYFWDAIKKEKGLIIIAGEKKQGKSNLISEIILNDSKDKLRLTGLHVPLNQQKWPQLDSVVHLGSETIDLDVQHVVYDGVERIVIDFNQIKNWTKWIDFVEQGQSVLLTISIDSVTSLFQKLSSEMNSSLFERFMHVLSCVIVQKLVGPQKLASHEILVLRNSEKKALLNEYQQKKSFYELKLNQLAKEFYQSLNQSLIQKLIRRKLDVKSAFQATLDPDELDLELKKLGL